MKMHKKKHLKAYTPPHYFVDTVDLKFDIYDDFTKVNSRLNIFRNPQTADTTAPMIFNLKKASVQSVIADNMVLLDSEYETGEGYFKLERTPDNFNLEITTVVHPDENKSLEGLYRSEAILCTQCEAEGFSSITPFPDRPDVMARFSCIITADKAAYPVLLSNGNLSASGDLTDGRHYVKWEDPFRKPSYLFALVAGDLALAEDAFTTRSGRTVALHIYVEKQNKDKCRYALKCLKQAMKWDEERFDREYDLDVYKIVAVNDFNAGAMENKGLNIFNSKYVLADARTATDTDFLNIQNVIAHEYFHNWTGNRVTLRNWFQLSLKEGLTLFRDQEFSADMNSRGVKRISDVQRLRAHQFPEDSGPMVHPVMPAEYLEINNFYTATVYEKGAELVRMVYQILGPDIFKEALNNYFKQFDGMAVTIEDFIKTMEETGAIDLSQFRLWYTQSGTPVVKVERSYDKRKKQLTVTFSQRTPPDKNQNKKIPLHIPVKMGLLGKDGEEITPAGREFFNLKYESDNIVFENASQEYLPSVFREFSAPVKIETDFTDSEISFIAAHDTDDFNRWHYTQQLFIKEITGIVESKAKAGLEKVSPHLAYTFEKIVSNRKADNAFIAKTVRVPSENELFENFNTIDVESIHNARIRVKQTLAGQFESLIIDIVENCSKADPLSTDPQTVADRSLKNVLLSYIGTFQNAYWTKRLFDMFSKSVNLTDEISLLAILCHIDSDLSREAVFRFYHKWREEPLLIDKWFSVQACSSLPDTLEKVKLLLDHPDFSFKNPNKIRSLISSFAMNNPVNFHRKDGKGYEFVAEQIVFLDKTNPQIAARIATAFNQRKRHDTRRSQLMKKALEFILSAENISKNVSEIVTAASA